MRQIVIGTLAVSALAASALVQAAPGDRLRARLVDRGGAPTAPPAPGKQAFAYGQDPLQALDYWPAQGARRPAPLIVFVHGGGWKRGSKDNAGGNWKAPHYTAEGYAYAAINYRLVPGATVEDEAADVAASLRYLIDHAAALGIDPKRIVLMGHSAGAHLVALVGTDERFLRGAGLSFANVQGVIPIDGAAYDVAKQIADGNAFMHDTYIEAFGSDPARQRRLSPTLQAAIPNAPTFLLIHVQRKDGVAQNIALEAALKAGGTTVARQSFPGEGLRGHMEINRSLGDPSYPATAVVDRWLNQIFG